MSELLYSLSYADNKSSESKSVKVYKPNLGRMPVQAPSWTEFLICPICTNEFAANLRAPITLRCGHSICKKCLATIQQCPYDQSTISKDLEALPINYALLQLTTSSKPSPNNNHADQEILPSLVQSLTEEDLESYKRAKSSVEELALYLKPNGNIAGLFSRPMQRKLVTLINCQLVEEEGRARSMRSARSLGERTITELILQHQNPQQLSANLWAAVRARGCQFLGPAMQEEVLKLVLLALEDGDSLCRKVLVMFVVQRLEPTFPQASKTSIGHVVQLLYRASCFIVSKRDGDSSLMQLKEEFRTYKSLRKEHDAQIVQIATEAGLRIAPDQWSALLYGDPDHKSDMQSLIDKQQSPESFGQSVQELMIALQRTGDPANLSALRGHLNNLAAIDASPDASVGITWQECSNAIEAVKHVVNGLVEFIQNHGNRKSQDYGHLSHTNRYKISFCRDLNLRGNCPRGQNCTFAHSDEELERYRAKMKKHPLRQQMKGPVNFGAVNIGQCPRVNISQPMYPGNNINAIPPRFNKAVPYRSDNSLHQEQTNQMSHHLMPTYPSSVSSSSTPNLSQAQLSPKIIQGPPLAQNRFIYSGMPSNYNYPPFMKSSSPPNAGPSMSYQQNYRPPGSQHQHFTKSSPNGYSPEPKKPYSSYHNNQIPLEPTPMMKHPGNGNFLQMPLRRMDDYSNNNSSNGEKYPASWRSGNGHNDKFKPNAIPTNSLMPKSPLPVDSNHTSPINRQSEMTQMEFNREMYRQRASDSVDGRNNFWSSGKPAPVFQFDTPQAAKDNFTRSDSILTSSTDDEYSFDSMVIPGNNKYGAIGIKTNQLNENLNERQWSDLHSMMSNIQIDDSYQKISHFNNRQLKGNFSNPETDMNAHSTNSRSAIPLEFQPFTAELTPTKKWTDNSSNEFDFTAGMCSKDFWKLINE